METVRRTLGRSGNGLQVPPLGFGTLAFSKMYGNPLSEEEGIALLQYAIRKGATFIDTSNAYGPLWVEAVVGKAIKMFPRETLQISTKFGYTLDENGKVVVRGTPEHVRQACEESLQRLDLDYIDIFFQHRVDANVPIERTMWELKKLVEEGKIRHIGLSEASVDTIKRAHAIHPITAIQVEWSLWSRDVEEEIVPLCRELGIGIVAYSPLGCGFFGGEGVITAFKENDTRAHRPRTTRENLEKNKVFYERISNLAKTHGCTTPQLSLAWLLHQGEDVVPLPGVVVTKHFDENIGSINVKLSREDIEEISAAIPPHEVVGLRYGENDMKQTYKFVNTPPLEGPLFGTMNSLTTNQLDEN